MMTLDPAISCATRGWATFPLKENSKQPATRSGLYAATTDLVTVRRWFSARPYNIGIWTGASKLLVIDLDIDKDDPASWYNSKGPEPGISWWCRQCEAMGMEPFETYCVCTVSGGLHVYFTVSEDLEIAPSAKQLGDLVDVRAGPSYVVAAGSIINGITFDSCGGLKPLPAPDWLLGRVEKRAFSLERHMSHERRIRREVNDDKQMFILRNLQNIRDAAPGQRNDTVNWVAWRLIRHTEHVDHDEIMDSILDAALAAGLHERETRDTLRSAHRAACMLM